MPTWYIIRKTQKRGARLKDLRHPEGVAQRGEQGSRGAG